MEVDTILLTDSVLEAIEFPERDNTVSPSYQIYLNPDLAQAIEHSLAVAVFTKDEFVSTEHLFIALIDVESDAKNLLIKFKINKENVFNILNELKSQNFEDNSSSKK